jgi:hypothetical protein
LKISFFYVAAEIMHVAFRIVVHDMRMNHLLPQLYDIATDRFEQNMILLLSWERGAMVGHFQPVACSGQSIFLRNDRFPALLSAIAARWQMTDQSMHIHISSANENSVHIDWLREPDTTITPALPDGQPAIMQAIRPNASVHDYHTDSHTATTSVPLPHPNLHHPVPNRGRTAVLKIANHGPLMLRLYTSNTPGWVLQCRILLLRLSHSLQSWNISPQDVNSNLSALLLLPAFVMQKPKRGGKRQLSAHRTKTKRLQDMT